MTLRRFNELGAAPAVLTAALLSGLPVAACKRIPLYAPSGSTLTLVASANSLAVNGSAEVTAVVIEGGLTSGSPTTPGEVVAGIGTPVHDGTQVVFSTTLGYLDPPEATTKGGRATVRLVGDGRSGTAVITAFSGAATSTLELDIGAAAATRIAVTASPQELPAGGGTAAISARVEDQQGNGISGLPVSFTTTRGSFSSTTIYTDSDGFAVTFLTTAAEATVTATAGGSASALNGTVLVTVR
jgi:hypothetical protein